MPPSDKYFKPWPRTATTRPSFNRTVKLFHPVLFAPEVEVVGNDLRANDLATVDCEVRGHLGLIHVLADQQATNIDTGVVNHGVHLSTNGCCAIIVQEPHPAKAKFSTAE